MKRKLLAYFGASAALVYGGSAAGQSQTSTQQPGDQVEEIVVTAQRHEESLQKVPITITALGGDALASLGAGSTRDLATLVPGLVFNQTLGSGTPFLRGVGQTSGAAGIEPSVAFYFDGVYFPTAASTVLSLSNVEQVAVLKGPQGTLFGRNSTGGVIQVTTRTPGMEPVMEADIGYGNYKTVQGHVYASTPLTQSIRTSFAFTGLNQHEGWGRNLSLNTDVFTRSDVAAQNKTLFELGERTTLTSNLLYTRTSGYVGTTYGISPGAVAIDGKTRYISEYNVAAGAETEIIVKQRLGSLTLDHDLGWAEFYALGSAQVYRDDFTFVQNGIPLGSGRATVLPVTDKSRTYTSELHLQSPSGNAIHWIGGFYFLHDRTTTRNSLLVDTTPRYTQVAIQKSKSYAVFGEASATVLPDTRLTLGVRYSIDTKSVVGDQRTPAGVLITTIASVAAANRFKTRTTWKEPTFRVALDHQLTDNAMLFASFNRGFKSGLYNLFTFNNPPADPEKLDAYELGTKTTLFNKKVRLNLSAFYYDYKNIQLRTVLPPSQNFVLYNAAQARTKGIDFDFAALVAKNLNLTGGFELLDGKYREFKGAACTVPQPTGGNITVVCDRSGARMLRSPVFAGNVGVRYDIQMDGGSEIELAANDSYNSGFLWEADGRRRQKAYHSVSASAKWTFPGGKQYIRLWGSNLANERIRALEGENSSDVYSPGSPRTYGVTLGGSF